MFILIILTVKQLVTGAWVSWRLGCSGWVTWDKALPKFSQVTFCNWRHHLDPCYCPELGCVVVGLVTSPRGPSSHVTRHYTARDLGEMMAGQDYLINVLPSTAETNNILNRCVFLSGVMKTVWWCDFRENLKHCKNVGFVNIGRGNIISEADILYALDNNFFRGAVLDVFNVEPLPEDSPLWVHPSVLSMRQKPISGESNIKFCSHASCCWRVQAWGCCWVFQKESWSRSGWWRPLGSCGLE